MNGFLKLLKKPFMLLVGPFQEPLHLCSANLDLLWNDTVDVNTLETRPHRRHESIQPLLYPQVLFVLELEITIYFPGNYWTGNNDLVQWNMVVLNSNREVVKSKISHMIFMDIMRADASSRMKLAAPESQL